MIGDLLAISYLLSLADYNLSMQTDTPAIHTHTHAQTHLLMMNTKQLFHPVVFLKGHKLTSNLKLKIADESALCAITDLSLFGVLNSKCVHYLFF